jgi:hypothetical protein
MGFVNLPVPEERVQEVYELLATPGHRKTPNRVYDRPTMERLWKESSPAIRKVLKHLMCHPGERVPTSDLVKVADMSGGRALGGLFARFRTQCLKKYDRDLPWETITLGDANFYLLSKETAELVDQVR